MTLPALALALALGGWSSVGNLGTNTSTSSTNTITVTTAAQLSANNVGVCAIGSDENSGGSNGDNGEVSSVADGTNSWTKLGEFKNAQATQAANGALISLWYVRPAANLASSSTITVTFNGFNPTAKAVTCWQFSFGAGSTSTAGAETTCSSGATGVEDDALNPEAFACATGVNQEHLFLRATACESNNTGYTKTAAYSAANNATANTGTSSTSMGVRLEWIVETASTSTTSGPTYVVADCASTMQYLDEVAAASGTHPGQPGWW